MKKFNLSNFSKVIKQKSFLLTTLSAFAISVSLFHFQPGVAYEIVSNGKHIGYVKTQLAAENVVNEMKEKIKSEKGSEATFEENIEFIKGRIKDQEYTSKEVMQYNFEKSLDIKVPAYLIKKDNTFVMAVKDEETANKVLAAAKSSFAKKVSNNISNVRVSFVQNVKIEKFNSISETKVLSENEALALVNPSTSVSRSNIRTLGSSKKVSNLFDVQTTYQEKSNVSVEPSVKRIPNSNLFVGQTKVKSEGKTGVREVLSEVTLVNGKQVAKKTLHQEVTVKAVEKEVYYGTKAKKAVYGKIAVSGDASGVASIAMKYLGTPYVYGGTSPSGFDCSGFTQYVYRQVGVKLPRTSGGQSRAGQYVSLSNIKPGDLLYGPGHVGIYLGNGKFIHSPVPGQRVKIQSLSMFPNLRHGVRLVG